MNRLLEIALATAGLIIAAPVIVLAGVLVRRDSPGPALFRQVRVGRDGLPFTCLKMRTMYLDTGDRPSHDVGRSAVTRTGNILRKTKIDELPQLWNVVRGDMSLVGPRPCLPSQNELIEARRKRGVLKMRPGITGVSQIAGVDMSDPERLATLDATYKKSFATDLRIIFATVFGAGRGDRVSSDL
jgi:O-antigen biosynthesis protein WbqP